MPCSGLAPFLKRPNQVFLLAAACFITLAQQLSRLLGFIGPAPPPARNKSIRSRFYISVQKPFMSIKKKNNSTRIYRSNKFTYIMSTDYLQILLFHVFLYNKDNSSTEALLLFKLPGSLSSKKVSVYFKSITEPFNTDKPFFRIMLTILISFHKIS